MCFQKRAALKPISHKVLSEQWFTSTQNCTQLLAGKWRDRYTGRNTPAKPLTR
jgi:hypothetical protein